MEVQRPSVFIILSVFLFLLLFSEILIAQNHISISVLSNGGEKQSSANYMIVGTAGQISVDIITTSNYQVQSGFWNVFYQDVIVDVEDDEVLPIVYKLEQNYPNPFNPSTIIKFAVPERCIVFIKIYDIIGSEVQTLVNEEMDAGLYQKDFNGAGYASGIYIYRMQAGNYISTKKMMLIK